MYSTDSFEGYSLYMRMFYPDEYYQTDREEPKKTEEPIPATVETYIDALTQEKDMYDKGFFPILTKVTDKNGKIWTKTRWVMDLKKNSEIQSKIDREFKEEMKRLEALD